MNDELPPYTNHVDKESGITFVFKREPTNTKILHIATHTSSFDDAMTPEDAMDIFFDGNLKRTFNNRGTVISETRLDDDFLWWYWIDEAKKVVMVVTCFNKYKP
ncbi:MAG: hypothetical protein K2X81_21165 [Candidatus Obscuribacterales bacterium]|nr:hypothetical protein [Candidatus Obscuribacterales bacterium]